MTIASSAPAAHLWRDERHGPLPALLLLLTVVTGLVDALSYLKLGHVFVANMTGNIVFLGFAVADAKDFSIAASLAATAAFLAGALVGGRFGAHTGQHRGRLLAVAIYMEIALVGAALVASTLPLDPNGRVETYVLIVLLALAMGLQNATARRLGVPDLTTTVLTLTLTGLAADSALAGGKNPRPGRRLLATLTMFLGAAIGALVIFHFGVSALLALTLVLLVASGVSAYRVSSSSEAWSVGT
ncbi:MAG TPA: YoaK family protein [Burkholderiaceae bacterium]|jgi:uncharacterized membrane protein YoaK (UPF0700 family)|nr:YoaK family protein [Burkholderiaceae bacterium]